MEGEKVNKLYKSLPFWHHCSSNFPIQLKDNPFLYFSFPHRSFPLSAIFLPLFFPSFPFLLCTSPLPRSSSSFSLFLSVSLFNICVSYISRNNTVTSHINVPLSDCNSNCNCDESQWEPVCASNGITYISPCLAGCKSSCGNKKPIVSISIFSLLSLIKITDTDFNNYLSNFSIVVASVKG